MFDPSAVYTITAPSGVDGYGEVAVLNDPTSGNFVGYLSDFTRSVQVRPSADDVVEGHGAVFGAQFYGPGAFSLEVVLKAAATWALSFARRDKLFKATEAMAADLSVVWTESGGVAKTLLARREQWPQGPDKEGKVLIALTSEDPYVYGAVVPRTAATSHTFTTTGTAVTYPVFTIASPSATVNISRTTPSPTETLTFTGLSGGGTVTIDFKRKTITQGGVDKSSAISWPSSTWWSLKPGVSNVVTITNAATLDWKPSF